MTDTTQPKYINAKRRGFLQGAAVAGGAIAGGAATSVGAAGVPVAVDEALEDSPRSKGYERTEHVKKYYARARF